MSGGFEALINAIPTGEANAIHQAELAAHLRMSRSELKRDIQAARRSGVPIMSGNSGYWIATGERDKVEFSRIMRKQAFGRLKSISAMNTPPEQREARAELLRRLEAAENGETE